MKLFKTTPKIKVNILTQEKSAGKVSKPNTSLHKSVLKKSALLKNWFLKRSLLTKGIIIVLIIIAGWLTFSKVSNSSIQQVQYQTTATERGTLINSVSGTGTISAGNSTNITTSATGIVKEVYVVNGDRVEKGQALAQIELDEYGIERQASAWASYLNILEAVKETEEAKVTADIDMWEARQDILDAEEDIDYKNNNKTNPDTKKDYNLSEKTVIDKTLEQTRKAFEVAEMKYKNADADIQSSSAKVASAWRDYQETSNIITAPASGVLNNFSLVPNVIVTSTIANSSSNNSSISNSSSSISTVSSQKIGKISTSGQFQATINLTEIDVTGIKPNQKATLTLDAFSDKTFTGKVLSVDNGGSVSSGVTTYPVTILLDPTSVEIYPNMAVNAQIITGVKNDVILIPVSAVQTTNGQSVVQVMKDGRVNDVQVETGSSNDTRIEIVSGLSEGDNVVTNVINQTSGTTGQGSSQTQSPFSGFGTSGSRSGFGGNSSFGGGNVRIMR